MVHDMYDMCDMCSVGHKREYIIHTSVNISYAQVVLIFWSFEYDTILYRTMCHDAGCNVPIPESTVWFDA